jgi:hypothetical protein
MPSLRMKRLDYQQMDIGQDMGSHSLKPEFEVTCCTFQLRTNPNLLAIYKPSRNLCEGSAQNRDQMGPWKAGIRGMR